MQVVRVRRQRKANKKLLSLSLALALLVFCCAGFAENAKNTVEAKDLELGRPGSITVILRDNTPEHNPIPGGRLTLYKVGELYVENNNYFFALTPEFEASGADLSDLNAEGLPRSLFEYAETNNIAGTTEQAGADGAVVFDNLTVGLYLIAQPEDDQAGGYYPVEPFLVPIPMTSEDGTEFVYDITAEPKVPMIPPPPIEYTDLTVVKVWEDDDDPARPASVTVQLFCDGEPYGEPAILNAGGSWTHTWEHIEKEHSWTVEENPVPANYQVTYDYTEIAIMVINTKKLVQTGQLNWPVPVFACAGVLLFMLGWTLRLAHKRKAEK